MATALILFELPLAGGAGTVGYAVYDSANAEVIARTTSGIFERPSNSGMYGVNVSLPASFLEGYFVADDDAGNNVRGAVRPDFLSQSHSEPNGIPTAAATPLTKLGYLFAALRNKVTVSATKKKFFDDAGVALWEKDLSDSGTEYEETEANAP